MCPEALRLHLELNSARLATSEQTHAEIRASLESRQPQAMEVDSYEQQESYNVDSFGQKGKEKERDASVVEGHTSQGNAHSPKKERAKARPWSATRAEETIWRGTATQAGKREKGEYSKTTKGIATSAESTDAMEQAAGPTKERNRQNHSKRKADLELRTSGRRGRVARTRRRRLARWGQRSQWNARGRVRSKS